MPAFTEPNYTQVPNQLLDDFMKSMDGSELKVVLYILRQTLGWQRESHRLTTGLIASATGLSERQVVRAAAQAVKEGYITREQGADGVYVYSANIKPPDIMSGGDRQNVSGGDDIMSPIKRKHLNKKNADADASAPTATTSTDEKPAKKKRGNNMSEQEAALLHAFENASGLHPVGADWGKWRKIITDWIAHQYTPEQVTAAVNVLKSARDRNGKPFTCSWPGSLDNTLRNLLSQQRSGKPASASTVRKAPLIVGPHGSFNF